MALAERCGGQPTVSLHELLEGRSRVEGETDVRLAGLRRGDPAFGVSRYQDGLDRTRASGRLDGYLDRLVDHEVVDNGAMQRRPAAMRQWLTAYAAATATPATYETIRDAATPGVSNKPTKVTALGYRDVLQRLWILDSLDAWLPTRNPLTRLTATPKHHLADPALAARLLGEAADSLAGAARPGGHRRTVRCWGRSSSRWSRST